MIRGVGFIYIRANDEEHAVEFAGEVIAGDDPGGLIEHQLPESEDIIDADIEIGWVKEMTKEELAARFGPTVAASVSVKPPETLPVMDEGPSETPCAPQSRSPFRHTDFPRSAFIDQSGSRSPSYVFPIS